MIIDFFSCLLWGTLCALLLTGLCAVVANCLSGKKTNILIAILLLLPLGYECVLGVGALYARGYVEDISDYVFLLTDNIGTEDAAGVVDAISREYPALPASVVENVRAAASGVTSVAALTNIVVNTVNDTIMSYFWARFLWAIGFMVAGTALLVYFAPGKKKSTYRSSSYSGYGDDCCGGSSYDCDYSPTSTSRSRYTDYE